jgi:hypothetical protein
MNTPASRITIRNDRIHRSNPADAERLVELADDSPHRRDECRRLGIGADHQTHIDGNDRSLDRRNAHRHVDDLRGSAAERLFAHIAHDSGNRPRRDGREGLRSLVEHLDWRAVRREPAKLFADRALARKVMTGECLTDNDRVCFDAFATRENGPFDDAHRHGLEIAGHDELHRDRQLGLPRGHTDRERVCGSCSVEWHRARRSRGLNAGQSTDSLQQALVDALMLSGPAARHARSGRNAPARTSRTCSLRNSVVPSSRRAARPAAAGAMPERTFSATSRS